MFGQEFERMLIEKKKSGFFRRRAIWWLRTHGFGLKLDMIEEGEHCAMIGYMKYMKRAEVEMEEMSEEHFRKAGWYMDAEIYSGIMNMCPRSAFGGGRNTWNSIRVKTLYIDQYEQWDIADDECMEEIVVFRSAVQDVVSGQTEADQRIIGMLTAGNSVAEVGRKLNLSRQSVRTRIRHLRMAFEGIIEKE